MLSFCIRRYQRVRQFCYIIKISITNIENTCSFVNGQITWWIQKIQKEGANFSLVRIQHLPVYSIEVLRSSPVAVARHNVGTIDFFPAEKNVFSYAKHFHCSCHAKPLYEYMYPK